MSNSQEHTSTPAVSPLSEFQPMEDVSSDVSVSLSPGVADGLKETAQENLRFIYFFISDFTQQEKGVCDTLRSSAKIHN
ncbi:hypothetical protein MFLAVUS_010621 [Mucor flavus]|uniref:Uncharacterized protein n=1 Tax=Mucor flavus TaxID=439312 RepID=A0ABP9ZD80_9FUNG